MEQEVQLEVAPSKLELQLKEDQLKEELEVAPSEGVFKEVQDEIMDTNQDLLESRTRDQKVPDEEESEELDEEEDDKKVKEDNEEKVEQRRRGRPKNPPPDLNKFPYSCFSAPNSKGSVKCQEEGCGVTLKASRAAPLASHMMTVHRTGRGSYSCNLCGQLFCHLSKLKEHKLSHTRYAS